MLYKEIRWEWVAAIRAMLGFHAFSALASVGARGVSSRFRSQEPRTHEEFLVPETENTQRVPKNRELLINCCVFEDNMRFSGSLKLFMHSLFPGTETLHVFLVPGNGNRPWHPYMCSR